MDPINIFAILYIVQHLKALLSPSSDLTLLITLIPSCSLIYPLLITVGPGKWNLEVQLKAYALFLLLYDYYVYFSTTR